MSGEAGCAASAWGPGLEGDAVADLEGGYGGADGGYGAGGFVAENHGLLEDERSNAAMFPVMDIRTADTSVVYGDEDIVGRSQFRLWLLCEGNIEWFVEDEGEVICGFCHCCEV